MNDYRKYLDPKTIARLKNIDLKARLVVEGFLTGLHRSPYHGFSVEFAEHRQYHPGDDTRHLDWKVLGRSDRYFIKQFEEETNLRCIIAVDKSASMKYASPGNISKFEYSIYLAAAISYLLLKQRDGVGLALYDMNLRSYLPPKSKQTYLNEILKTLDNTVPSDQTGTAKALDELAERIKRRGLVVIISDFLDDETSVLNALKHFRHRNNEVIAFQILDPRELDLKLGIAANLKDIETGEEIITQPNQIQKDYKKTIESFIHNIKSECFAHKIEFRTISTADTFDKALNDFLAKRKKV
jgi:uncharacterized protein (DUF58 family)